MIVDMGLQIHLLKEFIGYLNPMLAPMISIHYHGPIFHAPGSVNAYVCSRKFEFARIELSLVEVQIIPSTVEHFITYQPITYQYDDHNILDQMSKQLIVLADKVVTSGWSDQEIRDWNKNNYI